MNVLIVFVTAAIALAILCKLDLMRTERRAQNRRNWLWLLHANAARRDAQRAWRTCWAAFPGAWTEDMRFRESQSWAALALAQSGADVARVACKGKCPEDLKDKL